MNVFINAVSNDGVLILFNNEREIVAQEHISILGNESSRFISLLNSFVTKNGTSFSEIQNYIVVNGPGSFTGLRTIVLTINTLAYMYQKNITDMSYFDLFYEYPIVKTSSKRDVFVKYDESDIIHIETNKELTLECINKGCKILYGDVGLERLGDTVFTLDCSIAYMNIIKNITLLNKKIIKPFYIKKPNIS